MIPAQFEYVRPESLDEAVRARADGGDDAKVIAGGQSLMPLLRLRLAYPDLLVDVGGLYELRGVRDEGDSLRIGALTTLYQLTRDPPIVARCRTAGSAITALSHAAPAGDLPAVSLVLDATMIAVSPRGEREIAAGDFFVDYLTSALATDEIVVGVQVPKRFAGWGYTYEKFQATAQAWAIVGAAALVRRSDGQVAEARIGLTNMGSAPVRATAAEEAAAGAEASRDALRRAAEYASDGTSPPDDLSARPDYRQHLARVLTGRALARAAGV